MWNSLRPLIINIICAWYAHDGTRKVIDVYVAPYLDHKELFMAVQYLESHKAQGYSSDRNAPIIMGGANCLLCEVILLWAELIVHFVRSFCYGRS